MKSTKTNKGITLIALIITIVVLLILAVVAVQSITNDGILHYAQNAADSWNKASQNEAGILGGYLDYIDGINHKHEWERVDDNDNQYFFVSKCKACAFVCEHEEIKTESFSDDMRCGEATYCAGTCKELLDDYSYASDHSYDENSVCYNCGYTCTHEDSMTGGSCWKCYWSCTNHVYNDEGVCQNCGEACDHSGAWDYGYKSVGAEGHHQLDTCLACGMSWEYDELYAHNFDDSGSCRECGYEE